MHTHKTVHSFTALNITIFNVSLIKGYPFINTSFTALYDTQLSAQEKR